MLQAKQSQSSKSHNGEYGEELCEVEARRFFLVVAFETKLCSLIIGLLFHCLCSKPLPFDLMEHAACNATYVALFLLSFVSIIMNDGQSDAMHPFLNSVGGTSATNLWQHMDDPGGHSPVIF